MFPVQICNAIGGGDVYTYYGHSSHAIPLIITPLLAFIGAQFTRRR